MTGKIINERNIPFKMFFSQNKENKYVMLALPLIHSTHSYFKSFLTLSASVFTTKRTGYEILVVIDEIALFKHTIYYLT